MPRMSDHEEYLDSTMVDSGDKVMLLDAGIFREPEETGFNRTVFHIRVKLPDGRNKTWTMNKTTRKRLAQAWGDKSEGWVNHSVKVDVMPQTVRGELKQVLYGHPVEGDPEPQQVSMEELPEDRTQKIVKYLAEKTEHTEEQINVMVAKELENSGQLFDIHTAAILVARSLQVDLETTGIKVS